MMRKVARRHSFPGVAAREAVSRESIGSAAKHNNWSLGTDTGVNLLAPGKTRRGITCSSSRFVVNVMMAVHKRNGLLEAASIASATNAHRLGANEAPPAIISVFLGRQLSAVLDDLASSSSDCDDRRSRSASKCGLPDGTVSIIFRSC